VGKLDGRIAIITGAGGGIGAAVAKAMAHEGAKIVVNDIGAALTGEGHDTAAADVVVAAITDAGGEATANYDSITDYNAAENIIQTALDSFGGLDIVVNAAGNLRDRMIFNMTEAEWDAVQAVHLKGTFNTAKYASIYWRQQRKGHYRLINFTSISGLAGAPGQPNYAAAKLGIVGLTYSCANALARYGVTANAISPGAATRMTQSVPDDRQRIATPDDDPERAPSNVATPVVYLASDRSDWLTGQVIGARGYEISLYNKPEIIAEISAPAAWDTDDAFEAIERVFKPTIERTTFYPAPQVAPPA
jgi:NAD(P)-dependent dehydrogenase (short-subunit alcohol dehydrogenase family)